jgi:hypothetical protein
MSDQSDRRVFLKQLAAATGSVVVMPLIVSCQRQATPTIDGPLQDGEGGEEGSEAGGEVVEISQVPLVRPAHWDPIEFNRARGNAGAIPESYRVSINGPDGASQHLGKHLPYRPDIDPSLVPEGFLAVMWGDSLQGYARHPSSAPDPEGAYPDGHWFNWVKVRKAIEGEAEEAESTYSSWPQVGEGDSGRYDLFGEGEITDDGGRNTIYLVAIPSDVAPGDTVRVYGHCLSHGEYVDFLTL